MSRSILIATLLLGVAACAPAPEAPSEAASTVILAPAKEADPVPDAEIAFAHDARQLPGRFTGTLPCASCPGIDTVLVLEGNGSYTLDETWKDQGDGEPLMSQGTWTVDASQVLLLDPDEKTGADRRFQLLSHDELRLLDSEGRAIDSQEPLLLRREVTAR